MDIALRVFDERLGDSLYGSLRPFALTDLANILPFHLPASVLSLSLPPALSAALTDAVALLSDHTTNLPRDSLLRQSLSLYALTYVGIFVLYFSVATGSYYFLFDRRMEQHPRYLKNQVAKEIKFSLEAFPVLDLLTLPWFLGDVRGWSKLYETVEEGPFGTLGNGFGWVKWAYMALSAVVFLVFTDFCIYWVHRILHVPFFYKRLHKPHHKWIIPTPFASHAFHPVDGYLQSVPYHLCVYLFPIHKFMFIGLFTFVNLWSIFIHDSDMICDHPLENYINGPSHHTLHHMYFTCNYGQYFTWADKMGGSFRAPAKGEDPLIAVLAAIEAEKAEKAAKVAPTIAEITPTPTLSRSISTKSFRSSSSALQSPNALSTSNMKIRAGSSIRSNSSSGSETQRGQSSCSSSVRSGSSDEGARSEEESPVTSEDEESHEGSRRKSLSD